MDEWLDEWIILGVLEETTFRHLNDTFVMANLLTRNWSRWSCSNNNYSSALIILVTYYFNYASRLEWLTDWCIICGFNSVISLGTKMAKLRHHRHYHHHYYYYYRRLGAQYKLQVNAIIFRMQFKTGTTPASFSFTIFIFISISLKMWMMARLCCLRLYYKWKFVFIKLCATPDVMAWKIKNYFFPSIVATLWWWWLRVLHHLESDAQNLMGSHGTLLSYFANASTGEQL